MLGGSAAGQLISILLSPVLTRLYSPQQFGVLSVYSALLAILVVLASLRYELTIPMAASEEDALNLTALNLVILLAMTGVIGVAVFAFPERFVEALWPTPINSSYATWYRALFVLGFLCLGGYYVALYLATRDGAFDAIARTRFYQGVVGPVSQIGLALAGGGAPGLLAGSILGQSAGTIGLFQRVLSSRGSLLKVASWPRMRALAVRYRRFPLIASWAALIDSAGGSQLLYLLVSMTYSARIAGFIFLAERVVARPLSIVGTSILQVFMGEASRTASTDPARLKTRFYQVISRQFALALVWILVSNLIAALVFPTLFGERWGDAVVFLQAMSLGYLAQAIVLPVFHTLQILEKQTLAAAWQLSRLLLVAATFLAASRFNIEAPLAIFGYSVVQALSCGVLLVLMAQSIEKLQQVTA
ncbi:MAG: oligosaccharide flippase family protein [Alphaproteobacteria bacterium]|nr:oligosaccharide flippase family protein [Alphaproteobacteria bacterium]